MTRPLLTLALLNLLFFATLQVHSQSALSTDDNITIDLIHPTTKEVFYTLESGFERIVIPEFDSCFFQVFYNQSYK